MGSKPSSLFDFDRFLRDAEVRRDIFGSRSGAHSPDNVNDEDYKIVKLSGGYINVTVRAIFGGFNGSSLDPGAEQSFSVVMKYAPPFVAAIGEDRPFGTFRQVIESRALTLLASTPAIAQSQVDTRVHIPKLIRFDEARHVLVLEDLGVESSTVDEWLFPVVAPQLITKEIHAPDANTCQTAGMRLGELLATIHSDEVLYQHLASGEFANAEATNLVAVEVVGKVKEILLQYLSQEEKAGCVEDEAEIINRISRQEYERRDVTNGNSPRRTMFSVGDLWTGSVLMSSPPRREVKIGLIDWEFAGEGRALQDIGQFSAWLHLLAQASVWSFNGRLHLKVPDQSNQHIKGSSPWIFAQSLFEVYAHRLQASSMYSWISNPQSPEEEAARLQTIRSTWILHGRELIVDSTEALDRFERLLNDYDVEGWKKRMINIGCWYVRVAGQSSDADFKAAVEKEEFLKSLYHAP